ncbi:unnamed protein product [Owenia fusiformis]|uniref:TM7S3/TM198-like domain-containing protein n=1 Tax=Owenia fusiformis TaxID=6347 RepID=A0A8J1YBL6_OWEFU|nr:unnamed protein product [Owenia fusiformis]
MEFQLANLGFDRTQVAPSCEHTSILKFLKYDVYLYYGGEGVTDTSPLLSELQYFNNGDMQHLDPINLHKFSYTYGHGKTRLLFARYPNIATYYTVIVRNLFNNGTGWSSYVPVVSDGCHTQSTGWFNCGETYNLAARIVCTVVGVIGLFLCFFGHRFFRTEMFLVGATSTLLVSYILVLKYSTFSNIGQYITTGVSGLVGGILWFTFWYFVGIPVLSVLLIGLLLGYLISSIAFNLTPLGDLDYWATEFNYGMAFTCGILVVPVLLLAFTKQLNIIATSILGSFAVVVAIDVYIGSYMAYIIQDSIRKATIEDFRLVHTKPPFQTRDMILCVIWVLLTICGISFQNWREKDRKPFPDCPNTIRKLKARRRLAEMNTEGAPTPRTPLLADQQASARSYGIDPGSRSYGSPGTGAGAYPARTVDTSGFVDAGNTATDRQIDRYASQPT